MSVTRETEGLFGQGKCPGALGSCLLWAGPPRLTFLVGQAHRQNLPGGDGVLQKHVHGLRGDSGWSRRGGAGQQV